MSKSQPKRCGIISIIHYHGHVNDILPSLHTRSFLIYRTLRDLWINKSPFMINEVNKVLKLERNILFEVIFYTNNRFLIKI